MAPSPFVYCMNQNRKVTDSLKIDYNYDRVLKTSRIQIYSSCVASSRCRHRYPEKWGRWYLKF